MAQRKIEGPGMLACEVHVSGKQFGIPGIHF